MKKAFTPLLFSLMAKNALAEPISEFTEFTGLTALSVIALGILNALRPSIFLMIVFLLSMIALVDENRVLKVGFSFTAGAFLGYSVIASALMNLHGRFLFLRYFVVAFGIAVGLYKILSSLGYVKISTSNPLREKSNRILEKATSPASAFLVGGVMSFLSLSCVLPSYLLVTSLLSDGFSFSIRAALLGIFVGISVLPLALVTLGFHYGNKYAKLGGAVNKLSKMSGRGELAMGVVLVLVSVLYLLLL
ncbi:cytochrome C biogenesis protein [Palaeococcus pacificus DY20341]|uniref:Cytochrome C biogenesis protein n=1 Tax=Palaeococcus pacificus DY20341 TaxID=1343739 RepID=A0A075LZZ6_9EURY|nr:cytochrome C biogenesis protein [Palaeococcus pacificus]AIF70123.1 cytochrome C biogenesis protein [Palaeococcus pacificus DY20341]